jgi:tRNA 5-methylaminomethyl-2-thiouridine biosynthesis bifunctional protein
MKTSPVVPGVFPGIDAGAGSSTHTALLPGNDLPARWQGRDRFVVLDTAFGIGNNFLSAWSAWRADPQRCATLCFIAIEPHPLTHTDLARAHGDAPQRALADDLLRCWPPLTPNLHRLDFDGGHMQLLLALGDVGAWLPELVASVDAFCVDGTGESTDRRLTDDRLCKALGRLAAPGATLAACNMTPSMRAALTTAGFEVASLVEGALLGTIRARYAPAFMPRRAPNRARPTPAGERRTLIIGGGLAGCAAAWALAELGWHSTVLERNAELAEEGSGNPAGLFHGIVNLQDGLHARFNRAAALATSEAVKTAIAQHRTLGDVQGLLRLETSLNHVQMQRALHELGLPRDYVQVVSDAKASAMCGMPLQHPAWFYPGGGWVQPAALARAFFEQASTHATLQAGVTVHSLHFEAGRWQALDPEGRLIDAAPTLVLANAGDALRLLGSPPWPIERVRGQISIAPAAAFGAAGSPGRTLLPVAGSGYLLPEVDGRVTFGATAQPGDDDTTVRSADHITNLAQLARLTGAIPNLDPSTLEGRTAWRCTSRDRLPVIGAVPELPCFESGTVPAPAPARRVDQPRFVPRVPGLFVFTALGSRGITWSALGGRVVASAITGAPAPLETSLLDAIDPARFITRELRRSGAR